MSDYGAIMFMADRHHYVPSYVEAAAVSINSGCDTMSNGQPMNQTAAITAAINRSLINESTIDEAVTRVLQLHMLAGSFDGPDHVPFKALGDTDIGSAKHAMLAQKAAARSVTLLENRNNTLPFLELSPGSIALIGPAASDTVAMMGSYSGEASRTQSIQEAFAATFEGMTYAAGCRFLNCTSNDEFNDAIDAARGRIAVVAVGTTWFCGGDGQQLGYGQPAPECEMEGSDRAVLRLPGMQEDLIKAVSAVASKTIVVLVAAGPISSPWVSAHADALLQTFFGGQGTAQAVIDAITGTVPPSGRLPFTVPMNVSDLPAMSDYSMAASPGRTYRYTQRSPLYPFGFGRGYNTVKYSSLSISQDTIKPCDSVTLQFNVTSEMGPPSDTVSQVYGQWHGVKSVPPHPELKGFARVHLTSGGTMSVSVRLAPVAFVTLRDGDLEDVLAPGTMTLYVGDGQPGHAATLSVQLRVTGQTRTLESCAESSLERSDIVV